MFTPVIVSIAVALIFFLALPAAGAFSVRTRWKSFREELVRLRSLPSLNFTDIARTETACAQSGTKRARAGRFRLSGSVEAIEGKNRLWIRDDKLSAVIDMTHVSVYSLSGHVESGPDLSARLEAANESMEERSWKTLSSVNAGTRVFIGGTVYVEHGVAVFSRTRANKPLIVLYNGSDETLVERAIWAGRHRNEYWNNLTQASLAIGVSIMTALVSSVFLKPTFSLVVALVFTVAISPLLPILPPGALFFTLYRRSWRKARSWRARRDLTKYQAGENNADARMLARDFARSARKHLTVAGVTFALSVLVNFPIVFLTLRRIFG